MLRFLAIGNPRSKTLAMVHSQVVEPPVMSLARHVRSLSSVYIHRSEHIEEEKARRDDRP